MLRRRDILIAVTLVAAMGTLGCGSEDKASGPVTPSVDTVPPAAVLDLAANVNVGASASVSLTWRPGAELDLAGYRVYRHSMSQDDRPTKRREDEMEAEAPMAIVTQPSFTDGSAREGHSYIYSVSAFDVSGNESPRTWTSRLDVRGQSRTPDDQIDK